MKKLATIATLALAAPLQAATLQPWTEAVVNVASLEQASSLFLDVGNWRIVSEDAVTPAELRYWNLPAAAAARFRLICAPQASIGCIRFVKLVNAGPQRAIREAVRPWDTGGIFSLMVRTDDVRALYREALDRGWWAESPPISFQFKGSDLRNVVITGPHGINIAAYERLNPPFTAFPVGRISQAFSNMRMVKNREQARDYFQKDLGFALVFDSPTDIGTKAFSNLSIPYNLTDTVSRAAAALGPTTGETGRVEVMQIDNLTGHDVSAHAKMPNYGIISVRYPVEGLSEYRQRIVKNRLKIANEAKALPVTALGTINILAVQDADGSLTEFYEKTP